MRYMATQGSNPGKRGKQQAQPAAASANGVHYGGQGANQFAMLSFTGGTITIKGNIFELRHGGSAVQRGGVSHLFVDMKDTSHVYVTAPEHHGTAAKGQFTLVTHAMARGEVTPELHHQMTMDYRNTAEERARVQMLQQSVAEWQAGQGRKRKRWSW
ncbi:hypothetical protein AB0H73_10100 [Streptomyces olivoreticuli]